MQVVGASSCECQRIEAFQALMPKDVYEAIMSKDVYWKKMPERPSDV